MQATVFEFTTYEYAADNPKVVFNYRMHFADADPMDFSESIRFSDNYWTALPEAFRAGILQDLHLLLGISYYKLFCPNTFKTSIALDQTQTDFWNTLYRKGLGEFLYRNELSPDSLAQFTASTDTKREVSAVATDPQKVLVGIGGGKDSIVALELLKEYDCTGFIKETGKENTIARDVAKEASVPIITITRTLDQKVLDGIPGSYSGHVPVSAMYAFLGVLTAALHGQTYVVVANEFSSNFGNTDDEGNEVNHKWSGSAEFEGLFQTYVRSYLTPDIIYFSITRPFYELRVMEEFTQRCEKYFDVFSSCNRNFAHAHDMGGSRWCGKCPKCAFTFLLLSAFLKKETVISIFKKDLFEDAALVSLYTDLLGYGNMKPFDCVGTFDESRVALARAATTRPDAPVIKALLPLIDNVDVTALEQKLLHPQQALTVPSRFRLCGMHSALILGYGKEGKETKTYLQHTYPDLQLGIADQQDDQKYLAKQDDFDIIIKTPVIPGECVTGQYTTATNLFFAAVPPQQIIGITGTKGKSTTASLVYLMLSQAGKRLHLVGNIGTPALKTLRQVGPVGREELFVFELSSYQLADLDVSPHVVAITSLFPEHIDHHGTLEAYYDAKRNITRFQKHNDLYIAQAGFPQLDTWGKETLAQIVPVQPVPFSFSNQALLGDHNIDNAALAYTIAHMLGVSDDQAHDALDCYSGLPHRLQNIGTFKGVTFYDDSISTAPESAIAALRALKTVNTLILGGVDRGYDFTKLEAALHEYGIQNLILFPESGTHMLQSEEEFTVLHTDNMEKAIQFAYEHTPEGGTCVLSPAAPSYNLFTNFEERGDMFKAAVEKYGKL